MPVGILIPVSEAEPIVRQDFRGLEDYQAAVGGNIEAIDFVNPAASFFVNEEGKLIRLEMNRRATLMLWLHNPAFRGQDVIMGPAVLIGQPDSEGDTTDAPQELDDLIFDTISYRVMVETIGEPDNWVGNQARYDNWVDAYNAALSLAERWTLVNQVKVIPA